MKIYLAGEFEPKERRQRLWSYFYLPKAKSVDIPIPFLDSGAFSAWSQKKEILIQDYIAFIKANKAKIGVYANLDAIGDSKATHDNQLIMEGKGLKPLPVFHYGSDEKWLIKILNSGHKYMALGGMVPISTAGLITWLDRMFHVYLTDGKGVPIIKVHGFGLTSQLLMMRYPWYSVDSTSWGITGAMGSVYVPKTLNGKWNYMTDPWKINVSNRSPSTKEAGEHLDNFTNKIREKILEYLNEKGYVLGKSTFVTVSAKRKLAENERWVDKEPNKNGRRRLEVIEEYGLCNYHRLRNEANIAYFFDLEKNLPQWPWAFRKQSLTSFFK